MSRVGTARRRRDEERLACVLGEVDLVRALALAGLRAAVFAPPTSPSRYSRATVQVLPWTDPRHEPAVAVERLLEFGRAQRRRPVLFYDGDWELLLVSRHREQLSEAFDFVVADSSLVESLVDKARFQRLAQRTQLPVPPARGLSRPEDLPAASELGFPLLVKPVTRRQSVWSTLAGAKALVVHDAAALARVQGRLAASGTEALVQRIVPGKESMIESYHVYVDGTGAIAGEFTGRKLRTWPSAHGYTTALTVGERGDVRELGRDVCRRLGLRGVAKLDFKRDPSGALHLLEINPRFNLWHHPGALAGVNLPALVFGDCAGSPRPPVGPLREGVRWCSLAHDLPAARAEGVPAGEWLRWVARCEAKSGFALDDPLPLPRAALRRLPRLARAIGRTT